MVGSSLTEFWKNKKILVTGGSGFLGSVIVDKLIHERNVEKQNIRIPRSIDSDLRKWETCEKAVKDVDIVIHLAAKVGGIGFNQKYPGELFYDNAIMGIQLMEAARRVGVSKFVCIGTVCSYPKHSPVPFVEENIWDGYPEETNAPYGLAKKMLLVQSESYRKQYGFNSIYLIPVNLFGPGDNFHPDHSHVIPALIRKFIEAEKRGEDTITVWGTGSASREFLYVGDAAEAILLAAEFYNEKDPINIGTGNEITIRELVNLLTRIFEFEGNIKWDSSKPDGQPRRSLNVEKAYQKFNFRSTVSLEQGLLKTIEWYKKNCDTGFLN